MKVPDAYCVNDLLLWGKSFSKNALIAKGFLVEVPDVRYFSTEQAHVFHDQLKTFLGELDPNYSLQIQWSVSGDYTQELQVFKNKLTSTSAWGEFIRQNRFHCFSKKAQEGLLKREQLVVFMTHRCNTLPKKGLQKASEVERFLDSEKRAFDEKMARFSLLTESGRVISMNNAMHLHYAYQFFNPELPALPDDYVFNAENSLLDNCLFSDGIFRSQEGTVCFKTGSYYHNILIFRKWPRFAHPGIMTQLMDALENDFCITQNIHPLEISKEIVKEEKAIKHLSGNVRSGNASLETAIEQKRSKIHSLTSGYTMPYQVKTIVRVWDATLEGLAAKTIALRTAIQNMNGAQCHQVNQPSQAKSLYFETFPGWTDGNRKDWNLYSENDALSALIPVSNSFSGSLKNGETLYEGNNSNLVGVSSFIDDTPQHAILVGMTGAGKSVATIDFLSQTADLYAYTAIIEEGLSYGLFTKLMGGDPIIVSPDADLTINYLDTQGLPLSSSHLAVASKLCLKMIGISNNEDINNYRTAVIGEYLNDLYWNFFESWKINHKERYQQCLEDAYIIEKKIRPSMEKGSSFFDAFKQYQAVKSKESINPIDKETLLAFEKSTQDGHWVRNLAYAYFKSHEYPTHKHLVELMRFSKMSNHDVKEVDYMATMLSDWSSSGSKGKLFDGETNVVLNDKIAHFELGYIPESARELKEAAGFVIANFIRQHIIKMPRNLKKRLIFEEVSRFLDVPGGDVILSEAYAQLRKYACWVLCVTQQFSQLKKSSLYKVIVGNSKLFFLMKQNNRDDIDDIAASIGLPDTAKEGIQRYPLPEHQQSKDKCSFMTVYALNGQYNDCGTIRIQPSKALLYVASSNGSSFDQKSHQLAQYPSLIDGVIAEAMAS